MAEVHGTTVVIDDDYDADYHRAIALSLTECPGGQEDDFQSQLEEALRASVLSARREMGQWAEAGGPGNGVEDETSHHAAQLEGCQVAGKQWFSSAGTNQISGKHPMSPGDANNVYIASDPSCGAASGAVHEVHTERDELHQQKLKRSKHVDCNNATCSLSDVKPSQIKQHITLENDDAACSPSDGNPSQANQGTALGTDIPSASHAFSGGCSALGAACGSTVEAGVQSASSSATLASHPILTPAPQSSRQPQRFYRSQVVWWKDGLDVQEARILSVTDCDPESIQYTLELLSPDAHVRYSNGQDLYLKLDCQQLVWCRMPVYETSGGGGGRGGNSPIAIGDLHDVPSPSDQNREAVQGVASVQEAGQEAGLEAVTAPTAHPTNATPELPEGVDSDSESDIVLVPLDDIHFMYGVGEGSGSSMAAEHSQLPEKVDSDLGKS
eukprot:gene22712-29873_t